MAALMNMLRASFTSHAFEMIKNSVFALSP